MRKILTTFEGQITLSLQIGDNKDLWYLWTPMQWFVAKQIYKKIIHNHLKATDYIFLKVLVNSAASGYVESAQIGTKLPRILIHGENWDLV